MDAAYFSEAGIAAIVVLGLVAAVVAVLVAGVVMRFAVRRIGRVDVGYPVSYAAVVVGAFASWLGNLALAIGLMRLAPTLVASLGDPQGKLAYLAVALAIDLALHSVAVHLVVRGRDGMRPGIVRSLAVAAGYLAMGFALFATCVGVLAGIAAVVLR